MAGYSSVDDLISEMTTNGKFSRTDWNKLTHAVTAHVAGEWHCLFHSLGNPTAGVLGTGAGVGTNLVFSNLDDRDTGAILHGGDVSPDTKHILNASAFSAAATTMPAVFMLVDLLGFIPITSVTTTGDQATRMGDETTGQGFTFTADAGTDVITHTGADIKTGTRIRVTNSGGSLPGGLATSTDYWTIRQSASTSMLATSRANAIASSPTTIDITSNGTGTSTLYLLLARYTTGAGVQAFVTPSTALGAGTPNIRLTYVDAGGGTGKVTPTTLPVSKASAAIGIVEYSGTGAGKYGPFVPLAAGDRGVRSVTQFNYSATHTSGVTNVVLARPLFTLPMTTVGVAAERDLLNQLPSLPQVQDGACLAWMMYAGAATPVNSAYFGHIDFGWG